MPDIEGVKVTLIEIDQNTESVKVIMEGDSVDLDYVQKMMKDYGAVVHSIDEVEVGKRIASD